MIKELAIEVINTLPDSATIEDIIEALFLSVKIKNGLKDIEEGNIISHEDMRKEIESWK